MNVPNTNGCDCVCVTCKEHWIHVTGLKWPQYCSVEGCDNEAEVGAHLFNLKDPSHEQFIVPFCYKCNNDHRKIFTLKYNTFICIADKLKTCDKVDGLAGVFKSNFFKNNKSN